MFIYSCFICFSKSANPAVSYSTQTLFDLHRVYFPQVEKLLQEKEELRQQLSNMKVKDTNK